ncbi:hydrogenase maturation protease [Rhodococcus opacus]|uniref:Hydrogenase maturation protease n=1 Tax=Rhodococcus opacus TaxID=37919 RepID=A0AAX3YJ97_RHOOP|nr:MULTISPECIES: hydrogenase maturation protease [Rhodococcus]ELB89326.1 hydrogenase maturation protease [Rhodococcus wratislaviensis IFP 2016]NHU43106.1 hydrogenase maturation protease [Rhodococcus sp. A14]MBA8958472.1 hydrogenase maturation protease [Rhodococcus opacus]MBP2204037.1 hydrogenase maturation protease [Rhodococcus opacus]MCZ4587988.1 hydrogenase maturation protease [Rhodococcus opacus]
MTVGRRVLVAGVGNIFFGDDGFGPEVLRAVARRSLPPGVRAVDFGIRGTHLAYELLDGWGALLLVDAVPGRGEPGALRAFEVGSDTAAAAPLDAHSMDPGAVFASLRALGGTLPRTVVLGCQVENTAEGIGLSPRVQAAVDPAVDTVFEIVDQLLESESAATLQPDTTEG